MGLSSSQARLLNLTSRMHQIEYKAAKLEAEKLQMANESNRVYEDYLNALEKTKIQGKILTNEGSITYVDMTYNSMRARGYQIKFFDQDKIVISSTTKANYSAATAKGGGGRNYFIARETNRIDANGRTADDTYEIYSAKQFIDVYNSSVDGNDCLTGKIRLMSDLDFTNTDEFALRSTSNFTFDGNGHTISHTKNSIFGWLGSGTSISNLKISDANVLYKGVASSGILANAMGSGSVVSNILIDNSTIKNSTDNDSSRLGGIVGSISNGTIQNCTVQNTTIGNNMNDTCMYGGIVGEVYGSSPEKPAKILNCSSINNTITIGAQAGGSLVGAITTGKAGTSYDNPVAEITNCTVEGTTIYAKKKTTLGSGDLTEVTIDSPDYQSAQTTYTNEYYVGIGYKNTESEPDKCPSKITNTAPTVPPTIRENEKLDSAEEISAGKLFDAIKEHGYILETDDTSIFIERLKDHKNDPTWFTEMVNAGYLYIFKPDVTQDDGFLQVSVSTDTDLIEVSDTSVLKKAEAQYEADMKKIDMKDRKYDSDLAALDTERNAVKSEMETLKNVAKENVDRTFKLFS